MDDKPTSQMTGWQPIETYPRCPRCGEQTCDWGPTVLVRIAPTSTHHEPTHYVAHLEAGMWLTRCGGEPVAWEDLHSAPEAWMPIEGVRDVG